MAKQNKPQSYFVAKGKSLATKGFNLHEGDEVKLGHLNGGKKQLDSLVESKVLIVK